MPRRLTCSQMMLRLSIAVLAAAIFAAICASPATAQRRGGGMGHSGFGSHGTGFYHGSRGFYGDGLLGSPFFYPGYDTGAPNNEESAPPPPYVIIQAPADNGPRRPKLSPLLIEWRGDRYVRFGGAQDSSHDTDYAESASPKTPASPPIPATPAVLVYRDGHRDEISVYSIADGMIYVQGAYWQNGSRTRSIPLSALDPVATMQANRERGAKFMLPSASNVVIASF